MMRPLCADFVLNMIPVGFGRPRSLRAWLWGGSDFYCQSLVTRCIRSQSLMSVKVRLALLLGVLLMAFIATLLSLRKLEQVQAEKLHRNLQDSNKLSLINWIDLTNQPLKRFALDYGEWQALADFAPQPDPTWGDLNLKQNLADYEAHAVWVYNGAGQIAYTAQANAGPSLPPPAGVMAWARRNDALPGESFFAEGRDGLLQIWCVPLRPEAGAASGSGHLVVARLWHAGHLARLAQLMEASLVLAPVGIAPVMNPTLLQVDLPLTGGDGRPVRLLQARYADPDFSGTLGG